MKFRLIFGGSHSDTEYAEAIDRYLNRIKHFFPVEVTEVKPPRGGQSSGDVVVLDERGQQLDSLKFAKWLERLTIDQPDGVNFVVGGDIGLDDTVRQRADKLLSLSAMTLPHVLARVVLVEQIYRACTLMRNIPYHK